MVAAYSGTTFETTCFTYQYWYPGDNWSSLTEAERYLAPQARAYFWRNYERKIRSELEKYRAQGWEPLEDIGPQAIKIRRCEGSERQTDPADILLWAMTFGIAFIMHLLFERPSRYVSYVPVEFRVKMRRSVAQAVAAPGEALSAS